MHKPVKKNGIIVEGGWGEPIDYYSEEAQKQRNEDLQEKVDEILKRWEKKNDPTKN